MLKILEKINNISLPATIIIASIILGGFFYASQLNKQQSIERQQEVKAQEDRQEKERERALNELRIKQAECESLSVGVRDKWNNVMGVTYDDDFWEECVVTYTETKTGEVQVTPLRFMKNAN